MPFPYNRTYPGGQTYPGIEEVEPIPATVGADIPHLSIPFRIARGAAAVVEQDTADDVLSCALAILLTPKGYRAELSDFGLDDLTFGQGGPDLGAIADALAEWEPRADALLGAERDRLDELVHSVTVRLGTRSGD